MENIRENTTETRLGGLGHGEGKTEEDAVMRRWKRGKQGKGKLLEPQYQRTRKKTESK